MWKLLQEEENCDWKNKECNCGNDPHDASHFCAQCEYCVDCGRLIRFECCNPLVVI